MRAWVPLLIALLVTGGVLTAAAMVYSSWETQRRARLAQLTARLQRPPKLKVARAAVLDHPLERAALALVTRAGPPHTVARLTLWMVCAATFGAIAMALMAGPLAGALGLAAGGLPLLWLRRQGNLRSEQLAEQLPEAFELVGRLDLRGVLDELERRDLATGAATLCVGGGMGIATVIERL